MQAKHIAFKPFTKQYTHNHPLTIMEPGIVLQHSVKLSVSLNSLNGILLFVPNAFCVRISQFSSVQDHHRANIIIVCCTKPYQSWLILFLSSIRICLSFFFYLSVWLNDVRTCSYSHFIQSTPHTHASRLDLNSFLVHNGFPICKFT